MRFVIRVDGAIERSGESDAIPRMGEVVWLTIDGKYRAFRVENVDWHENHVEFNFYTPGIACFSCV